MTKFETAVKGKYMFEDQAATVGGDEALQPEEGGQSEKVKIGSEEYTPEQLTELANKSKQYDELLPDYTKKATMLKEYEKVNQAKDDENLAPYEKPGWKPQNFEELGAALKDAKERGSKDAIAHLEKKQGEQVEVKKQVDDFITEIKKTDKDFSEKDFFDYAVKHSFPVKTVKDLKAVHSAFGDASKALALGREEGRKGKVSRNDNVSGGTGSGGKPQNFSDLRAKGGSIQDIASDALDRMNK